MNRTLFSIAAFFGALMPLVFDSALKGAVLLATAALVTLALWRASAAARHLVWLVAIVALLIVPVLSLALPQWRVLPQWAGGTVAVSGENRPYTPYKAYRAYEEPSFESTAPIAEDDLPPALAPKPFPAQAAPPIAAPPAAPAMPAPTWREWLPLAWCLGFAALAVRLLAAHLLLRRASRQCPALTAPPDEKIAAAFADACTRLGIRQRVTLLLDKKRTIPVVWGVFRPRLMLPLEARDWRDEQLCSVLLHELGHIKRRDTLVQWLTQIACALHWWNPLVWLAAWRLHAERERACDDLVLASGVRPSAYAEHLLDVATRLSPARWTSACGLAMARKSSLEGRLMAVLSEKLNRNGVTRALAIAALVLGAAIALPVAMLRAADAPKNPDYPLAADIYVMDPTAFPQGATTYSSYDEKSDKTGLIILAWGKCKSSTTSSRTPEAWTDAGSITSLDGHVFDFLRSHKTPDTVTVDAKTYDLTKGRVILLGDNGTFRQLSVFPPAIPNGTGMTALAKQILALPPQEQEKPQLSATRRGRILDRNAVVLAESSPEGVRSYPFKALAAHAIGIVGMGDAGGSVVGRTGAEQMFNDALVKGEDVELSIDAQIQSIVDRTLIDSGIGRGAVVVIDLGDGGVVSTASVPNYDPSRYAANDREAIGLYMQNRAKPLLDRVDNAEYPPGAAFMPVTALAGAVGSISPSKVFTCTGGVSYGGRVMKCTGSHGPLDATGAIKKSCNCYFYQLANTVGLETFGKTAHTLGLGAPLLSYLHNDSGVVSDAAWFTQHYPGQQLDKSSGQLANMSIGQGYTTATPLQMAWVAAQIAKSGKALRPHIQRGMGELVDLSSSGLPPEAFQAVRTGMFQVVNAAGGTGKRAMSDRFSIAGKTGTTQVYLRTKDQIETPMKIPDYVVWFIGYAPADKPKYAFAVMIESGSTEGSGGKIAAPIARRIMEEAMSPLPQSVIIPESKGHFEPISEVKLAPTAAVIPNDSAKPEQNAPKNQYALAHFQRLQKYARENGDIPGGLVALLDRSLANKDPKLDALAKRLDATRDWTAKETAEFLDAIAATGNWVDDDGRLLQLENYDIAQHGKPLPSDLAALPWGKADDGLQHAAEATGLRAAFTLDPAAASYAQGTQLPVTIHYHNSGTAPLVFPVGFRSMDLAEAQDEQGRKLIAVWTFPNGDNGQMKDGPWKPKYSVRLEPGHWISVPGARLTIAAGRHSDTPDSHGIVMIAPTDATVKLKWSPMTATWNEGYGKKAFDWKERVAKRIEIVSPMPKSRADRESLINRVTLALTGEEATAAEVAAFIADDASDALAKLTARFQALHPLARYAGWIKTGEQTFKVTSATTDYRGTVMSANGPGLYELADSVVLQHYGPHANFEFTSPEPVPHPRTIELKDKESLMAPHGIVWRHGSGVVFVAENTRVRKYDYSVPGTLTKTDLPGGIASIPEELRADLVKAFPAIETAAATEAPKGTATGGAADSDTPKVASSRFRELLNAVFYLPKAKTWELKVGERVGVKVDGVGDFMGEVFSIAEKPDPWSGLVNVKVALPENNSRIRAGLIARFGEWSGLIFAKHPFSQTSELLGTWRGKLNAKNIMLSFHRPPTEEAVKLDIYEGEATIGTLARFNVAEDGKSAVVVLDHADSATYGTLRPGENGALTLELDGRQKGQTEVTLIRDADVPATEPRQAEARELFELWKSTANADGTIPGTFIGMLATEVRAYLKANPNLESAAKMPKLLPRFDTRHDWTQSEAVALLDDVAYYSTAPIAARVAKSKLPSGPLWRTEVEFQDIPVQIAKWSEAKDGLRIGLRVVEGDWRVGGKAHVELWLHNAGEKAVTFKTTGSNRQDVGLAVAAIDAGGHEHWAENGNVLIIAEPMDCTLPAGYVAMAKAFDVTFDEPGNDVKGWIAPRFRDLKSGNYQLRCRWMDAHPTVSDPGQWTGELTAPDHAFTLAANAADAAVVPKPDAKPPGANIIKVPDDQYVKSGFPKDELVGEGVVWNDAQNGLSLGYRITGDEWRILGKELKVELWVRNSGEKDLKFQSSGRRDIGLRVKLKNETGVKGAKELQHEASIVPTDVPPFGELRLLPPGHALKVKEFPVALLRRGNDVSGVKGHYFLIDPGAYKFHCELELPGFTAFGEGGKQLTPAAGEWTGTLTTRETYVMVVAPDAPAPKPRVEHLEVEISKDGEVSLERVKMPLDELKTRAVKNAKKRFTIRADKDVPYAKVIEVVDALKAAGVTELSFSDARVGDGKYRVANLQANYKFDDKHGFSICRPSEYPQFFTVSWPAEGERPACWLRTYPNVKEQTQGKWAVVWEPGTNVLWWVDDTDVGKMTLTDPAHVIVDREGRKNNFSLDFGLPEEVKTEFRRLGFVIGRDKTPGLEIAIGGNTGGQSIVSAEFGAWSIEGTITDSDGKPLANVPVRLSANQELKTEKTDAKGEYRASFSLPLELLAHWRAVTVEPVLEGFTEREMAKAGEFNVLLRAGEEPQHVRIAGDKDFQPGPIPRFAERDLIPSQPGVSPGNPGRADFVMLKAAEITGEIVTAVGKPAPPHFIAAATPGQRPGHNAAIERSDAQGHFRLKGIPTNKPVIFTVNPDGKPGDTSKSTEQRFEQTGTHNIRIVLPADGSGNGLAKIERLVVLQFAAASEVYDAVKKQFGEAIASAVLSLDVRGNALILDSSHQDAARVREFVTTLDQRHASRLKPEQARDWNDKYAAVAYHTADDMNFVLIHEGFISTGLSETSADNGKWRIEGNIHLVDSAKTKAAGKNVDKRVIPLKHTSDAPGTLSLDGRDYDLKAGRVFILRDEGKPEQLEKTMPLRGKEDLEKLGGLIKKTPDKSDLPKPDAVPSQSGARLWDFQLDRQREPRRPNSSSAIPGYVNWSEFLGLDPNLIAKLGSREGDLIKQMEPISRVLAGTKLSEAREQHEVTKRLFEAGSIPSHVFYLARDFYFTALKERTLSPVWEGTIPREAGSQ